MTVSADGARFLSRLRDRLAGEVPHNPAHPLPPAVDQVPAISYRSVDPDDLAGSFIRAATAAGASVRRCGGLAPTDDDLIQLMTRHNVRRAVVSAEPAATATADALARLGVDVGPSPASPQACAEADLGVTSAVALVAATGSLVLDSTAMRTRATSLLPQVHLCVAPDDLVVRSPSEVFRPLTGRPERLPSNLVFVTGPSRTGDIEQILTIGVHGPTAVEILQTNATQPLTNSTQ
jgi:L-lactate dehydrogenase complex protein LldG